MSDPADWCARFGAALAEVADGVGALAVRVGQDWPDVEGWLRAERAAMVHRALERAADDTDALAARVRRVDLLSPVGPVDDLLALLTRLTTITSPARHRTEPGAGGMRLPGVDGERTAGDPGMRLPGVAD